MRPIRRSSPEIRVELTPLIDVVFLLLTFFIFSLVMLVRARTLDVRLPALGAAADSRPPDSITIALDSRGGLFLEGESVEPDALIDRVRVLRSERPDARLLVAADESGQRAQLLDLINRLAGANLGDFAILARPADQP
ncbi:MAG: biopolymer transporter ExbD [Phycisphaeraceae bacterium]|nr:biopolymer transporter ExbD [Phycisphaeraceae bacterium]